MKHNNIYKLLATACIVATGVMAVACADDPEPIPAEELYLRNFIKKYGLIDPEQTWNMAREAVLEITPGAETHDVDVLVNCGGSMRRVADLNNITEATVAKIDVPAGTDKLYIVVDGKEMFTTDVADGRINLGSHSRPAMSRDESTGASLLADVTDMAWIVAAEDLGNADDFDFNDIIFRIEDVTVNYKVGVAPADWQVVEDEEWVDITAKKTNAPASRDDSGTENTTGKRLTIKALAAGGTLPLYLHYRNPGTGIDYIIGNDGMHNVTGNADFEACEWHRWFGVDDYTLMINTGYAGGVTAQAKTTQVIYVSDNFTLSDYSYVDYDGDAKTKKENWEWTKDDLAKYDILGFYITVSKPLVEDCDVTLYSSLPGTAPQMFLIPDAGPGGGLWHWPVERRDITEVYSGFADWVGNVNNTDWFLTYSNGAAMGTDYMRK